VHGGVSTNVTEQENLNRWQEFEKEYIEIRKSNYSLPTKLPDFIGHTPNESFRFLQISLQKVISQLTPP
jgi:hypothetical protein